MTRELEAQVLEGLSAVLSSNGLDSPLIHWWIGFAFAEVMATAPKAEEYGSTELVEAGAVLQSMLSHPIGTSDASAMEVQIYLYVLGKIGRWTAAMRCGERVSDDTLFDIGVYVRMAQKIRDTGEWP